jgi:branched-chain amino acid transport system substrate-binding protein
LPGLLVATVALGCSASAADYQACATHADCRAAFGFGSICGTAGLCEQARLTERCDASYPEDLFTSPGRYRQAIVLGSLMDRSSPAHVIRERAARLAVKAAADAGGIDGKPVGMVFCNVAQRSELDDLPRPAAAVAAGRYLASTLGVPAIVGPSASTDVQQVWEAVRAVGTVVMSPAATSPALTALEPISSDRQPGLLWRTAPPDSLQGTVIAEDMLARGVARARIIRESGPYGEGLASVFAERFKGGRGVLEIESITAETQIAGAAAAAASADIPEILFISSQQDWIVKFLNAAGPQAEFARKTIFLTDAAANQAVLNGAAGAAASLFPRVRGTRPAPRDASDYVLASFAADYRAEYRGENPLAATFSAHAYDAAWLVLYGAAWSVLQEKAVTGRGIARGLRRLRAGTVTPLLPASWAGVLAAFREGGSLDVSGASGELDFDPVSRELRAPIEIWAVEEADGKPVLVHVDTKLEH